MKQDNLRLLESTKIYNYNYVLGRFKCMENDVDGNLAYTVQYLINCSVKQLFELSLKCNKFI